jgi:hypothetical protein
MKILGYFLVCVFFAFVFYALISFIRFVCVRFKAFVIRRKLSKLETSGKNND